MAAGSCAVTMVMMMSKSKRGAKKSKQRVHSAMTDFCFAYTQVGRYLSLFPRAPLPSFSLVSAPARERESSRSSHVG